MTSTIPTNCGSQICGHSTPGTGVQIDALLELSARQEKDGVGDAPWPPHYRKGAGEPRRAPPSKR